MQITGLIEDVVQSYINLVVQTGQLKSENDQLKELVKKMEEQISVAKKIGKEEAIGSGTEA